MKTLRYICAQPAIDYYTWQVEVLINNFISHGVPGNHIDILCAVDNGHIPVPWQKLQNHYNNVRFYFYNDTRTDKSYIPSIYFNLVKQHLHNNPELCSSVLFLHDCDIVFTRPPNFNDLLATDTWYLSDTRFYINYDYVVSKGLDVYNSMCSIVGIDPKLPKLLNNNSGGAQYIVKNTQPEFWHKVELDSTKLYSYFSSVEHLYVPKHSSDYPIQKWTAGMWSLLWNAWLHEHETVIHPKLDFAWVTSPLDDTTRYSILHNAGVVSDPNHQHSAAGGLFYKGDYRYQLPYNQNLNISSNYGSYYYWNEICKTAKVSVLLER